ncbi:MAG: hypothetical protein WCX29_01930 [Candidatus Peribacteraceae bacterium]|nr:hypothetical protein [Candidatus Peribacteria bacterium]
MSSQSLLTGNFHGGLGIPEHLLTGEEPDRTLSKNRDERQMQILMDSSRRRAQQVLKPAEGEGEG